MRISSVNNISVNNNKPVFKGYRTTPNAFSVGATYRNKEDMDALVRSYADADSRDIAVVGLFPALFNRVVDAAEALKIRRAPEYKTKVAELDNLVRAKAGSLNVEA